MVKLVPADTKISSKIFTEKKIVFGNKFFNMFNLKKSKVYVDTSEGESIFYIYNNKNY